MDHFNEAVLLLFCGFHDDIFWAVPVLFFDVCPGVFVGSAAADKKPTMGRRIGHPMVFLCS
jgi:hypothetical protein